MSLVQFFVVAEVVKVVKVAEVIVDVVVTIVDIASLVVAGKLVAMGGDFFVVCNL